MSGVWNILFFRRKKSSRFTQIVISRSNPNFKYCLIEFPDLLKIRISRLIRTCDISFFSKLWFLNWVEGMSSQLTQKGHFSIHSKLLYLVKLKLWFLVLFKIMISRFTQNYDFSENSLYWFFVLLRQVNNLCLFRSE